MFGSVASDSTAFRVIDRVASEPGLLDALRSAHARARDRFWQLHGAPGQSLRERPDETILKHRQSPVERGLQDILLAGHLPEQVARDRNSLASRSTSSAFRSAAPNRSSRTTFSPPGGSAVTISARLPVVVVIRYTSAREG